MVVRLYADCHCRLCLFDIIVGVMFFMVIEVNITLIDVYFFILRQFLPLILCCNFIGSCNA